MIMSLIRFLLFGLLIFAVDIYLRVASASLDSKLEKEDPLVAKKVERKGKLMFEPGLLTALDNENLLTNDHDELVNEINMLMFTMSLYLVLIAIWVRTFFRMILLKLTLDNSNVLLAQKVRSCRVWRWQLLYILLVPLGRLLRAV